MLATVLFDEPVRPEAAERAVLEFVVAAQAVLGHAAEAYGLHLETLDGIHGHAVWPGVGVARPVADELGSLWPHGLAMFSRTHNGDADGDRKAWGAMTGGGVWQPIVSRHGA